KRSGEIKKEELALTDDRFHVAPQQIKEKHVPEQVPRAIVQKRGADELPTVGRAQPAIAQRQILADESGLVGIEEKLGDKNREVCADQAQENDAGPLNPAPGRRRRFSAGEAHESRVSQRKFVVDGVVV